LQAEREGKFDWISCGQISLCCAMPKPRVPKTPKVVPITEEKHRLIASDEKSRRIIFSIGTQRVAFDFLSRVTQLPPHTGDQPAPVLPMENRKKRET